MSEEVAHFFGCPRILKNDSLFQKEAGKKLALALP